VLQKITPQMSKRLFVAINLSPAIKKDLVKILSIFPKHPGINLTKVDNLHLTIEFLGEIQEELIPTLQAILTQTCQNFNQFEIIFGKLGAFPNWDTPHIIWISLISDTLTRLQSAVHQQIVALTPPISNKLFHPHLTLVRIKTFLPPTIIHSLHQISSNLAVPQLLLVQSIDLMASQLTTQGPIYTIVSSHPLGQAN